MSFQGISEFQNSKFYSAMVKIFLKNQSWTRSIHAISEIWKFIRVWWRYSDKIKEEIDNKPILEVRNAFLPPGCKTVIGLPKVFFNLTYTEFVSLKYAFCPHQNIWYTIQWFVDCRLVFLVWNQLGNNVKYALKPSWCHTKIQVIPRLSQIALEAQVALPVEKIEVIFQKFIIKVGPYKKWGVYHFYAVSCSDFMMNV